MPNYEHITSGTVRWFDDGSRLLQQIWRKVPEAHEIQEEVVDYTSFREIQTEADKEKLARAKNGLVYKFTEGNWRRYSGTESTN